MISHCELDLICKSPTPSLSAGGRRQPTRRLRRKQVITRVTSRQALRLIHIFSSYNAVTSKIWFWRNCKPNRYLDGKSWKANNNNISNEFMIDDSGFSPLAQNGDRHAIMFWPLNTSESRCLPLKLSKGFCRLGFSNSAFKVIPVWNPNVDIFSQTSVRTDVSSRPSFVSSSAKAKHCDVGGQVSRNLHSSWEFRPIELRITSLSTDGLCYWVIFSGQDPWSRCSTRCSAGHEVTVA